MFNGEIMIDVYLVMVEVLDVWELCIDFVWIELVIICVGYVEFELYDVEGNVILMFVDLNVEVIV